MLTVVCVSIGLFVLKVCMIEVGDLVWDNMTSDIGIIVSISPHTYRVWWDESCLLGYASVTVETHYSFKEHPQCNSGAEAYCLLENREKYYESR